VDELAAAKRHAHVRGAAADGFEEEQVARLHVIQIDLTSELVLIAHIAGENCAVPREDVLHEPLQSKPDGSLPPFR